ncbi:FGGY-family carbohydrate kinase [Alicyclobacillus ferrooxydans]|uniref:Carbohydrate kinase n=1 Tax=Alicyclobacillus ferrooxydans TaxID=471514 RepID=A0A0P9EQP3_9BACL|nr:FGGY-family carbohydrate kinase [Alicyclobacillus ferrooxydans]KPV40812.1 hypothetical protein AN477_21125 [Alicyclobacillus ferrooxydans]
MFLVLDVGTTGARALLIDTSGRIHGMAYREYKNRFLGKGAIEQDGMAWWQAVTAVVRQVLAQGDDVARGDSRSVSRSIEAVAVTSQRATVLPVNASGESLAPAILWQDKRTLGECQGIAEAVGEEAVYQTTGLRIDPYFSLPKVLWFQHEHPDIWKNTYTFLTVHDWIVYQLTGRFATEWTQASRTQLFDVRQRSWATNLAQDLGLDSVPFPDVHPTGSVLQGLSKQAAEILGLKAGTPVVLAGGDQQCAAIGLGVTRQGQVKITTGTGTFIVSPVDHPVFDSKRRVLCSVSAVPNQWILEAGIFTTGAVLRWWRDELADWAIAEGAEKNADPYDVITSLAGTAPPGSQGALLIPHFAGSAAPYWNASARGLLFGLGQHHTKADLARAVLEGIALETSKNLALMMGLFNETGAEVGANPGAVCSDVVDMLDEKQGSSKQTVHVTGGMTRSCLFNQIQADVYGRPVTPASTEQATALGAAVLAAVAIGAYEDLDSATAAMCKMDEGRTAYPDETVHDLYQHLQHLHHRIYSALEAAGVYGTSGNLESSEFL